jgi:hypothetical protein
MGNASTCGLGISCHFIKADLRVMVARGFGVEPSKMNGLLRTPVEAALAVFAFA